MQTLDELFKVMSELDGAEEIQRFLTDLCTPQELAAMSERWHVAGLLEQGIPYRQIYELTGVSTATVTRVAKALKFGAGYANALKRSAKRRKYVRAKPDSDRHSKGR